LVKVDSANVTGWKGKVNLSAGGEVRAVVSKRGVDDGNQKGGGSLQPAKENQFNYIKKKSIVKFF